MGLLAFCSAAYHFRPGSMAAIYIWPFTLWVLVGMGLCILALRMRRIGRLGVAALWLAAWFLFDDQPWAFGPRLAGPGSENLTVVSLNCAGGSALAAEEALATNPDVVLLQESPNRAELERFCERLSLAQKLDWVAIVGPDASILTHLPVKPVELPPGTSNFVAAASDQDFIVSLRLAPPVFRLDYWSPDCWRDYAENRARRKQELDAIIAWVRPRIGSRRLIVGGDFNIPYDPWVQASLREIARDAFRDAGYGWGGTAINTMPLVRIDQVWTGKWSAWGAVAFTTEHSDHRGVVVRVGWEN